METKTKAEAVQDLKDAINTNNRIEAAFTEIKRLEQEIKSLDGIVKTVLLESAIKQMRLDDLKKELENATKMDVLHFENQLLNL